MAEPRVQAAKQRNPDKEDPQNKSLEKLLRDTKKRVQKSKDLWNILPRQVCNAISKEYSSQLCWNGTSTLKLPEKEKDSPRGKDDDGGVGLDTQPRGSPSPFIHEQIQILHLITDKLKTAFNGGDIQWVPEIGQF